ncbi:MAG: HD family hydrolase [Thermoproteota archaeon]|nr:HD family hydrolase [Candidatus Brockarchaeota archaeon]MBO3762911.1 HD family hydrolase [Candidatus Brockarchaeota archaeon]MBO3768310.1 HD family hydrolase [Candidatus Brockarchaeota archaeon]MBO3800919.1 HD family hydrolase [Candidatus Brockarchaeota archaeon]
MKRGKLSFNFTTYLKGLARTGWMQRGVPKGLAESVAEHSFESAIIAFELSNFLAKEGVKINPEKTAVVALLHDLHEVITGDIPRWTSQKVDTKRLEVLAFKEFNEEIEKLLLEYLLQESIEAKVAFVSDKLSTFIQAKHYYSLGIKEVKEIMRTTRSSVIKTIQKEEKLKNLRKNNLVKLVYKDF